MSARSPRFSSTRLLLEPTLLGHIGGGLLERLITATSSTHPALGISVLLRSVPELFVQRYPNVKIVNGTFDDFEVIEEAVSKAEIVIRKNPCSIIFLISTLQSNALF